MRWTKQHSQNAVAAKHRLRIIRAQQEPEPETNWSAPKLTRHVPDFTINIRTRRGDRCQITATRFGKQLITGDGIKSVRQVARGIEMMLRHCEP